MSKRSIKRCRIFIFMDLYCLFAKRLLKLYKNFSSFIVQAK
jgi:hypothetical protein